MRQTWRATRFFTIKMMLDLVNSDYEKLLRVGDNQTDFLKVYTRLAGVDEEMKKFDNEEQNYLAFPCQDGKVRVLETEVKLLGKALRVGVPLALIGEKFQVIIRMTDVSLDLFVDGVFVDQNWTFGQISQQDGVLTWSSRVRDLNVWNEALPNREIERTACKTEEQIFGKQQSSMQYWTPPGHNTWMGDTSCFYHDGVFHLFYLFDRRHGSSKFGSGAHQMAHASTKDLVNWEHHPLAVPITEEYETVGTGNASYHQGRYYIFYGLHTDRIVTKEETFVYENQQEMEAQPFFKDGKYPMGATYAVSDDGIHFEKVPQVIHGSQNPMVYKKDGLFYMFGGYAVRGTYVSKDLQGWKTVDNAIPYYPESYLWNTDECQSYFEWNGWHYIIAGRTGFWMSRNMLHSYKNIFADYPDKPRWDIYDGLWVPTVAPFKGNRRILAGWSQCPGIDYAGHLVFRELVQMEDGTLGMKWVDEMIPKTGKLLRENFLRVNTLEKVGALPESYYVFARIKLSEDVEDFGLCFNGTEKHAFSCELRIDPKSKRMQFGTPKGENRAENVPSISEILCDSRRRKIYDKEFKAPNMHFLGQDFAIENVEGLEGEIQLQVLVKYDPKSRSTIIDICVNQQRTMITQRTGKGYELILFATGAPVEVKLEISDYKIV